MLFSLIELHFKLYQLTMFPYNNILLANRLHAWLRNAVTRVRASATIRKSERGIVDCSIVSSTTVRVTIHVSCCLYMKRRTMANLAPPLALLK